LRSFRKEIKPLFTLRMKASFLKKNVIRYAMKAGELLLRIIYSTISMEVKHIFNSNKINLLELNFGNTEEEVYLQLLLELLYR
jgi:hypothetical protein